VKPVFVVGDASSAFGITWPFAASASALAFWLRRRRNSKNTTAAMIITPASDPPTAPPMTPLETPSGLAEADGVGVLLAAADVLTAVENAVGAGTVDESATFRS